MRLQTKLLLVVVPLIVVPLLALGWIGHIQLRATATEKALREMGTLLDQVSRRVEAMVATAEANAELFANSALLQRYVLTADEGDRYALLQPTLLRLFLSYQQAYPEYAEIRILLPDGYEDARAARADLPPRRDEVAQASWFHALQATEEENFSAFMEEPELGRFALLVARKLRLRDPTLDPLVAVPLLRGYLAIAVDLAFLGTQVAENRIGSTGAIFFCDGQGRVLFHPDTGLLGALLPPTLAERLQRAAGRRETVLGELHGERVVLRSRRIDPNLYLVGALPESELLAAGRSLGRLVAAVTVATIGATSILMILVLNAVIVRPIEKLRRAAREIGAGNLEVPVETHARDEIGDLARSFQEMASNLGHSNDQIRYMAYHDSLTGLPNRPMFKEYLGYALAHAKRSGRPLGVLFLDLDNFKWVNDTLGHHVGDELLKEVSRRLMTCLRREDYLARPFPEQVIDMVARLGGDEFLILVSDLGEHHDVEVVAKRIVSALSRPVVVDEHVLPVTSSIGITVAPADGEDVDKLVKNADIAMYHAKEQGKNTYRYFSEQMNEAASRRLALEGKLRRALERDEFVLHYQPQLDARTGEVVGFEALLRWQDPEGGLVPPGAFIPVAEETGLILPMGEWVLREACRQLRRWLDDGLGDLRMSVNVSSVQFGRGDVPRAVEKALRESGVPSHLLDVELTETSVMTAQDEVIEALGRIKALGVEISLDDFGTGYSSLSYLRRFPIDRLKIDRSFLRNLPGDPDDAAIVSAIIAMARSLHLEVTAEGVERPDQQEFLALHGCDILQGFLYGRPVPPEEIPRRLRAAPARAFAPVTA